MTDNKFTLIVPMAADKPEYADGMPYIFAPDRDGVPLCLKSIGGLPLDAFGHIYLTVLKKHVDRFGIDTLLDFYLHRLGIANAKVTVLAEPTASQAETVAQTIEQEGVEGPIFIKDADGYFVLEDLWPHNAVALFPLERMELVDPRNKSFASVDDMSYITNIIEKRVISTLFSAGGYCFESAADWLARYRHLCDATAPDARIYMSHIIYSMLLEGRIFRPLAAGDYKDWGTSTLYRFYVS